MKNTFANTSVRCILFQEKGTWYGAALEFNIVVDGDSESAAFDLLNQAVKAYFSAAKKNKLGVEVLNQVPDKEYVRMWMSTDHMVHQKLQKRRSHSNAYGSLVLRPAMA